MIRDNFVAAQIEEQFRYIIDSNGRRHRWRDPEVVHIWPVEYTTYFARLVEGLYTRHGCRFRGGQPPSFETLQVAKQLCTGRECLSFSAIVGGTCRDIATRRTEDEISVYYGVREEGPCQNGAWLLVNETFVKRLELRNAVFPGHPTYRNNYVGQGLMFGVEFLVRIIVADILEEAENALRCVARDHETAQSHFNEVTNRLIADLNRWGLVGVVLAVRRWAIEVGKIPRARQVKDCTKILCFGGGGVAIVHRPLQEFFAEQNVIIKIQDIADFLYHLESEASLRLGFERNVPLEQQFNILQVLLAGAQEWRDLRRWYQAMLSATTVNSGVVLPLVLRRAAASSKLLSDQYISVRELLALGNTILPFAVYQEGTGVIGRFQKHASLKVFAGLVHVAFFNCQPSQNVRTLLRSVANERDIPFVDIELEGPWLTTDQQRLLESVTVQARRRQQAPHHTPKELPI